MQTRVRYIVLCIQGAICLAGCTMLQRDEPLALQVAPAQTVWHGAARAEAQYALGRYYRGQARYDQAAAAFREALQANPDRAEARDALAVILAGQGRYEEAVAELEKAVASAPLSASIRNNLGYAYRLQGRNAEAVATLEMATALDPASARARDNLQRAREGAAVDEKIAKVAAAKVEGAQAIDVPATPPGASASVAAPIPVPAQSLLPAAVGVVKKGRLEVSNGNGVTGMAQAAARQFRDEGYARPRLTNEAGFHLATTEIQYRSGFEQQARALQALLRPRVPISESPRLRTDVQVRLALGKDAKSVAALVVAQQPTPLRIAVAAP